MPDRCTASQSRRCAAQRPPAAAPWRAHRTESVAGTSHNAATITELLIAYHVWAGPAYGQDVGGGAELVDAGCSPSAAASRARGWVRRCDRWGRLRLALVVSLMPALP